MKTFKFYGVCGNRYKLNDSVFEAIEDPSDGYRSYLESIEIVKDSSDIFFSEALGEVEVLKHDSYDNGYKLVDVSNGHVWLEIGTDNYDDYYPCFRFVYHPMNPNDFKSDGSKKSAWEKFIESE